MLSLQCWTDCGALDSSNQMDDICRRGFVFPTNGAGMHFNHGNIKLDDSVESFMDEQTPEATSGSGKQQHFYIFSEVGVGRPYIIDSGAERRKPVGYDSLYLSKKVLDDDGDGVISAEEYEAIVGMEGKDPSSYEHEFVITDPTQVLPKYVVRFAADLDPDEDEEMSDPLKVYDRHDFFDPVLYRPVSLRDKMIGSHSMGEAANHKLVSMSDAYNAAVGALHEIYKKTGKPIYVDCNQHHRFHIGKVVQVLTGGETKCFMVGRSCGWMPVLLEIDPKHTARGGDPIAPDQEYQEIKVVK